MIQPTTEAVLQLAQRVFESRACGFDMEAVIVAIIDMIDARKSYLPEDLALIKAYARSCGIEVA